MKIPIINHGKITSSTFQSIIYASICNPGATRSTLAELSGVSTMTVGKAVDSLLSSRVFTAKKLASERGRCPEAITLSQKVSFLIVDTRIDNIQVIITDPGQKSITKFNHYLIDGLTYEDNILLFFTNIRASIQKIENIYAFGVLSRLDRIAPDEQSSLRLLTGYPPDIFRGHGETISDYLCKFYPRDTVLYILISDSVRGMVVPCGHHISGGIHREACEKIRVRSEKELFDLLAQKLSILCSFIMPSVVIIESDRYGINEKILSKLSVYVCNALKLNPEEIPRFITVSDIPLPDIAMVDALSQKWAHAIACCKNTEKRERG